jgi:predicted PolB exonuclease-like 3'-5' exonuclease
MKLNDLCRALNLPGKPDGIDGSQVEQLFAEGRITEVADYCECDVVSTYRLWLLHELFKGAISAEEHERSELALSDFIVTRIQDKPHWARLRAGAAVEAVVKMTVIA